MAEPESALIGRLGVVQRAPRRCSSSRPPPPPPRAGSSLSAARDGRHHAPPALLHGHPSGERAARSPPSRAHSSAAISRPPQRRTCSPCPLARSGGCTNSSALGLVLVHHAREQFWKSMPRATSSVCDERPHLASQVLALRAFRGRARTDGGRSVCSDTPLLPHLHIEADETW